MGLNDEEMKGGKGKINERKEKWPLVALPTGLRYLKEVN